MSERFQATVNRLVLALGMGWILYIGRSVIVPVVICALVVYVIVGLTAVLFRLPLFGRFLSLQLGYTVSDLSVARNGQI